MRSLLSGSYSSNYISVTKNNKDFFCHKLNLDPVRFLLDLAEKLRI
jgi:hypothetical protein